MTELLELLKGIPNSPFVGQVVTGALARIGERFIDKRFPDKSNLQTKRTSFQQAVAQALTEVEQQQPDLASVFGAIGSMDDTAFERALISPQDSDLPSLVQQSLSQKLIKRDHYGREYKEDQIVQALEAFATAIRKYLRSDETWGVLFELKEIRENTAKAAEVGQEQLEEQRKQTELLAQIASQKPRPTHIPDQSNNLENIHFYDTAFVGRDGVLDIVHVGLAQHRRFGLSGEPGMGKTRAAIEYIRKYQAEYGLIEWVSADSVENLQLAYAGIGYRRNIVLDPSMPQATAAQFVKEWLGKQPNCLLVADNADQYNPELRSWFPGNAFVLVTTRSHHLDSIPVHRLESLEPPVGAQLVLKRANRSSTSELDKAQELSAEFGGLPLALDQAGAFLLNAPNFSVAEYLRAYQRSPEQVITDPHQAQNYPRKAVWFAYTESLKQLEQTNPQAASLVRLVALLAPLPVPMEMLKRGLPKLGEEWAEWASDGFKLNNVLKSAYASAWLSPTNSMHRMAKAVVRLTLKDQLDGWLKLATDFCTWSLKDDHQLTLPLLSQLLPHAEFVLTTKEAQEPEAKASLSFSEATTLGSGGVRG